MPFGVALIVVVLLMVLDIGEIQTGLNGGLAFFASLMLVAIGCPLMLVSNRFRAAATKELHVLHELEMNR